MKPLKFWLILAVAVMCAACLARTGEVPVPVTEVAIEEPFVEPTGTPTCQPDPEITLELRQIDDNSVWLHTSGLQPGEVPRVIYSASAQGEGMFGELGEFQEGADEQGEFFVELDGLELGHTSPDGPYSATWDIRLIHTRGVACATITLP